MEDTPKVWWAHTEYTPKGTRLYIEHVPLI
jgi:hypothetical protein